MTRIITGADERNRTVDLLITNELLYQLSYIGLNEKKLYQSFMGPDLKRLRGG